MTLKLAPSMRMNRRYLLIRGTRENIEQAILEFIGVLGWAKASPFFVEQHKDAWILAVTREEVTHVRAALALSPHKLDVLRVSGTLKGLGKK